MKIDERLVIKELQRQRQSGSKICLDRFRPRGWWECDLARVTKAGYLAEYEIKLSTGDFRADFKKTRSTKSMWEWNQAVKMGRRATPLELKHDVLATMEGLLAPKEFWFVMPEEMAEKLGSDALLPYAGLMTFRPIGSRWLRFDVVQKAPRRQESEKLPASEISRIRTCTCCRYWDNL